MEYLICLIKNLSRSILLYYKIYLKCKNRFWEFCFSCDKQINSIIHRKICDYLKKHNYKVEELIKDKTKINDLIEELNKCKPKLKMNESSMVLVHHPVHSGNTYFVHNKYFNICCNACRCADCCMHYCGHFANDCDDCYNKCRKYKNPLSTILTGDVVLDGVVTEKIKKFVGDNIPIIFQVPHHGSYMNSKGETKFINKNSHICSVIPCGYMYNHPSNKLYEELTRPYIVDVKNRYCYIIQI